MSNSRFVRLAATVAAVGIAAVTLVYPAIGLALGMIAIVYAMLVLRPEERTLGAEPEHAPASRPRRNEKSPP
jgi:hypothetical protein